MMRTATEISKVQEALKKQYTTEFYNEAVEKVKSNADNDLGVLAHVANDPGLDSTVRLFAIAAMGE